MSIYTNNTQKAEIPYTELPPQHLLDGTTVPGKKPEQSMLARLTAEAAFSFVVPKLQAVFESIHQPGYSILDTLAQNISELQDAFTQALYAELSALDIDFSVKLTLRLDKTARLALVGDHPDSKRIDAMLLEKEELSLAFAEIAAQSAALRDLRSLSVLMAGSCAAKSYKSLAGAPGENTYQMSLKGDMNHFYFART